MQRVTSADDVKWCIDSATQGISRNGSELGLQEIFKELSSFPSVGSYLAQLGETTNSGATATTGVTGGASPSPSPNAATGEEKMAQAPYATMEEGQTMPTTPTADAGTQPLGQRMSNGAPDAFSRGIPRVPSLEVLKMFLGPTNPLYSPSIRRPPEHDSQSGSAGFVGGVPMNGGQIPTSVTAALPQGGVIPPAPHSAILAVNPAAAAAALQFSQFTSAGLLPQSLEMELFEKSEQRRARRMLSNRESARRSRKRKQEHLHTLEEQLALLHEEKAHWLETRESLTRRCISAEEECARLKEENMRLRDELKIVGMVKSELFQSRAKLAASVENESEAEK